jgi:pimeloyl-CoA synthetase
VALTDLQGRFEFLNLRIDQVMESQEMKAAIAKNSKKIREIDEALIRQGLKDA